MVPISAPVPFDKVVALIRFRLRRGLHSRPPFRRDRLLLLGAPVGCLQRSRPPDTEPASPVGMQHPPGARASRPHAVPSWVHRAHCFPAMRRAAPAPAGGNRIGSPGRSQSHGNAVAVRSRGEPMGEAIPGFLRAGRPRFPGGWPVPFLLSQYCRSIRVAARHLKELHPYSCAISVHSWFVFIRPKRKRHGCFSSE